MAHATESAHRGKAHGAGRYVAVWVALLVLTALTYAVRRYDMQEPWHLVSALLIAVTKATLVALVFMHLWDHGGATRLAVLTSVAFAALLIGLVLVDNATRFPYANPPRAASYQDPAGAPRPPAPAGRAPAH
ncbi:MAG TPA: cytochrome C oxidase subunit IV family protein [Anaeromyxobacteraceae bacterium]|nr:cytochrome C oxidase subunit IV family protein [Anaeromyxobacteraceae bacterium]